MVEHRSVVNYVHGLATQYRIRPGDKYLQFSSMSFDVFAEELFCTLTQGATLVVADAQATRSDVLRGLANMHNLV